MFSYFIYELFQIYVMHSLLYLHQNSILSVYFLRQKTLWIQLTPPAQSFLYLSPWRQRLREVGVHHSHVHFTLLLSSHICENHLLFYF